MEAWIRRIPGGMFNLHLKRAFPDGLPSDAVLLELEPEQSCFQPCWAMRRASMTCLVDVDSFARKDVAFTKHLRRPM